MDSGLVERILPSIRRPQMLLIHRNGGVDNPETCGQIACSVEVIRRMETCGQIACTPRLSERWRPAVRSRARSGDYPSVSRWAQAARSGVTRLVRCVDGCISGQTQGSAPTPLNSQMYGFLPAFMHGGGANYANVWKFLEQMI